VVNGSSKSWWRDSQTDWTSGKPARAVDLLAKAYDDPGEIASVVHAAGLEWEPGPSAEPAHESWNRILRDAQGEQTVDIVAAVLQDEGSSAFHSRLGGLLGGLLGVANARRAIRYGLPPAPIEGPDRVLESLVEVSSEPGDQPVGRLEAITSAAAGLQDPRASIQAVLDAMHRTAMIEVGGRPSGTGFLVGSDLLLTAAHVIDAHRWPPLPRPQAVAVFDFAYDSRSTKSQAETGIRVPVDEFVTASLPTRAEVVGTSADWNAPFDNLDFALLKLAFPVPAGRDGAERGTYPPDPTIYNLAAGPQLFIVQHPLGEGVRMSYVRSALTSNANGTRIRYSTNTLHGSSGSPVVDVRGRLVALHHYSTEAQNQGVPFWIIAKTLLEGPYRDLFLAPAGAGGGGPQVPPISEYDAFRANELMGRPFVDRANLRDRVREMVRTNAPKRTLAITGQSGSGVSYSYGLASHVAVNSKLCTEVREAAPGGLVAFKIDLRDYIGLSVDDRGWRITATLLSELGIFAPQDQLAQEARNITTVSGWVRSKLRNSDQQWWIFFDSIDNLVATKQGNVDELIHAMIALAEDPQVPLRVVVAGQEADRFALDHTAWLEEDIAEGLFRIHVEQWIRARAKEDLREIDEKRLTTELANLFPQDGPLPEPRRLAPKLPAILNNVLVGAVDGS
jgi:hypothetical protein